MRLGCALVAALLLAGCNRRVEVTLRQPGSDAAVTCFGADHIVVERNYAVYERELREAACRRFGYTAVTTRVDEGGLGSRLNPGTPGVCL